MGPLLCAPLVFTCDMKGLLFLCQFWSIINRWGDPLAGDPVPTETSLFRHIVNEYLLVQGTWLGGHGPGKVQSQESCPVSRQGPVSPRRRLGATVLLVITKGARGKCPPGTCISLSFELFKASTTLAQEWPSAIAPLQAHYPARPLRMWRTRLRPVEKTGHIQTADAEADQLPSERLPSSSRPTHSKTSVSQGWKPLAAPPGGVVCLFLALPRSQDSTRTLSCNCCFLPSHPIRES